MTGREWRGLTGLVMMIGLMGGGTGARPAVAQEAVRVGVDAWRAGRYEDELAAFRRALDDPAAVRWSVRTLALVGRYGEAEALAAARVAGVDAREMWTVLGEVRQARGRLPEAAAAYRNAIRDGASDRLWAELHLAELARLRGALDSSRAGFERVIDRYNAGGDFSSDDLAAIATAARYLGAGNPDLYRDAVRVYDRAVQMDSFNFRARALLGDLFLDRFNNQDAARTWADGLALNPSHPLLLLGAARSQHFDYQPQALVSVERSLAVNPNLVPARVFLARLYLEAEAYDRAGVEVARALAVNPASLDAWSVRAAIRYLRGDTVGFEGARREVERRNPHYAELYTTLADLAARNRQYADAVRFARRAVQLDDQSWEGFGLLGLNELRAGAIDAGIRDLETAFAGDPFNPWIKNTLDLTDTFTEYTTVTDSTGHFAFVFHHDESQLLSPYFTDLAERAYTALADRYGYEPPTPIRVEVYPRHADFSVRTVGLAGMGALGVSFGSVLAMDSPSARERGTFNWGSTLWHEIAHAFHLGMSAHRVPRWFTEGLAVYEERRARDGWGWGEDASVDFLLAYREGRLPPVSRLNDGFVRPAYPGQVIHSYYLASLVCEYIDRKWGSEALLSMLRGFRAGRSSAEVVVDVLDRSPDAFDREIDRHVRSRFRSALAALADAGRAERAAPNDGALRRRADRERGSFLAQLRAGRQLVQAGQLPAAREYLERARDLFPEYGGQDSPRWLLAQVYQAIGDTAAAERELVALTAVDGRDDRALLELARLREMTGDPAGASEARARALFVYPLAIEDHVRLAELYDTLDRPRAAIRERAAVVALAPVDLAEARYQLARAYYRAGELSEARHEVLRALEGAPNFERAQDLLLAIRERSRR